MGGPKETAGAAFPQNDDNERDALRPAPNDDGGKDASQKKGRAHLKRKLDKHGQDATKQHHTADNYSERNTDEHSNNILKMAINTALPDDDEGGESLMKREKIV